MAPNMLINALITLTIGSSFFALSSWQDSSFPAIINHEPRVAGVIAKRKPDELLHGNPKAKTKYSDQN